MSRSDADTLRLGTRASPLAVAQSGLVARQLESLHEGLAVELVTIVSKGDKTPGDLSKVGGKGLFTEELEEGLVDGSLDLAVHSLKDLPVEPPEELDVVAFPKRADPRDFLISEVAEDLDGLPEGATVLTGSLRRRFQVLARRPDLEVLGVRGNVDTRLRKWRDGGHGAVILAAAGLDRLGRHDLPGAPLDPEIVIPAPGQGTLAVQVRRGSRAAELCRSLHHAATGEASEAERIVVATYGGDCTLPLGSWAIRRDDGPLRLIAALGMPDGSSVARGEGRGSDAREAAEACLEELDAAGAREILERLRR